ncbi:MAG: spore germination protein GerW family protein [Acidimicrobiia bacterium]
MSATIGLTRQEESTVQERVVGTVLARLQELVGDALVYGEPIERGNVTIIPASMVLAGGGGGGGDDAKSGGSGEGGGMGLVARPVGAYVIRGDEVSWKPAISPGVVVLVALVGARVIRRMVRSWS